MNPSVVGRLAPSPTGAQHVGNARTYLLAWLSTRSRQGKLPLRIEDIDSPRVKVMADRLVMRDLRWLGLEWEGEPVRQTQRLHLYEAALRQLQEKELVYPCTCTRRDIEHAASAPHGPQDEVQYPGTCAHRSVADAEKLGDQPFAWRFRGAAVPSAFVDGFRGLVALDSGYGGDFVVWKSAGTPAYQLAVVVDDAAMGVTEVLRGDDLIPSTPRQLQLYAALGLMPPEFVHVPLVVGEDGRRLAKRHGDTRLSEIRKQGITPEALLGLLAWSCGWLPKSAPTGLKDLLSLYNLDSVPRAPFELRPKYLAAIGYSL